MRSHEKDEVYSNSKKALLTLSVLMGMGVVVIGLFTYKSDDFTSVAGRWLIIAGSAMLSGGLVGFLFGIPRTLQQEKGNNKDREKTGGKRVSYAANTNLEQISDWLTKIIVGVSLTKINEMPRILKSAAKFAVSGSNMENEAIPFVFFLIIYYSVAGFLFAYLWTRLYLASALREADMHALVDEVIRKKDITDAEALKMAERQLDPNEHETVPQKILNDVISTASDRAKTMIFNQANKMRRDNWKKEEDKPKMEKTIPIFRALIHADPKYHRYHAQLGYALKDKREPDYERAGDELSIAIKLRGDKKGYLSYEINRLFCRIKKSEKNEKPWISDQKSKQAIVEDLRAIYRGGAYDKVGANKNVHAWMAKNNVNRDDIVGSPY